MLKEAAYDPIKRAGEIRLYKMGWFLHFKEVARQVSRPGDTLYVIAATLGTNRKATSAREALRDVCRQSATDREIVLCVWDAASTWGVQVADYGLWAVQRGLESRPCTWLPTHVNPTLRSTFCPWGRATGK